MYHPVAVGAQRNEIFRRLDHIAFAHLRYRDSVMHFNETFSQLPVEFPEVKSARFADGPVNRDGRRPVNRTALVAINRHTR